MRSVIVCVLNWTGCLERSSLYLSMSGVVLPLTWQFNKKNHPLVNSFKQSNKNNKLTNKQTNSMFIKNGKIIELWSVCWADEWVCFVLPIQHSVHSLNQSNTAPFDKWQTRKSKSTNCTSHTEIQKNFSTTFSSNWKFRSWASPNRIHNTSRSCWRICCDGVLDSSLFFLFGVFNGDFPKVVKSECYSFQHWNWSQ